MKWQLMNVRLYICSQVNFRLREYLSIACSKVHICY